MPMYTYQCSKCFGTQEVIKKMAEYDRVEKCPECGYEMTRDFQTDLPHTAADRYDSPIVSDSLAVSIDQIAEHKRAFPDIQITDQGQPVLDNYKQHKDYLEKCGFAKMPKRQRARGKKISTKKEPTPSK